MYYLRARYMNPVTGRFLSRDPLPGHIGIPKTLHKYLYASANPVDRVDPLGLADMAEVEEEDTAAEKEAEEGVPPVAQRVICFIDTGTDVLAAIYSADMLINAQDPMSAIEGAAAVTTSLVSISGDIQSCSAQSKVKQKGCNKCFAAGTTVHTDHGELPIEKIHEGEAVVARDTASGKLEPKPVTALTPQHKDSLLEIRVEGERSPLRPSTHHPFWARRGDQPERWINSGQLRVGDRLLTMDGNWRAIVAIALVDHEETVYNFTVAKDHDYFVGQTGFLVHNATCDRCGSPVHHMVPENMSGFDPARNVLSAAGIGINDAINKVPLPGCFHSRLHTNDYREFINGEFTRVGPGGAAQLLGELGGFLTDLADECGCPYEP